MTNWTSLAVSEDPYWASGRTEDYVEPGYVLPGYVSRASDTTSLSWTPANNNNTTWT